MSKITPEAWRKLDEAQRATEEARAAWLAPGLDRGTPAYSAYARARTVRDILLDDGTVRALIDAARPKCQRCGGGGFNVETRIVTVEGHFEFVNINCPDCDGTGWEQ